MIDFKDNGDIEIEFADTTVKIRPPKYGAFKRIRRERERISDAIGEKLIALPSLAEIPEANDEETDAEKAERRALVLAHRDRAVAINDLNNDAMVELWTFILFGHGDDFKGLALEPLPPTDPDEWPASLISDAPDYGVQGMQIIRTNPSIMDEVFKHWGKVRFRSGLTPTPPM